MLDDPFWGRTGDRNRKCVHRPTDLHIIRVSCFLPLSKIHLLRNTIQTVFSMLRLQQLLGALFKRKETQHYLGV